MSLLVEWRRLRGSSKLPTLIWGWKTLTRPNKDRYVRSQSCYNREKSYHLLNFYFQIFKNINNYFKWKFCGMIFEENTLPKRKKPLPKNNNPNENWLSTKIHVTSSVFLIIFTISINCPEFQALWKSRYLAEIEEIRLEIKRLEDIANSLPVECWNTIRLEPWEKKMNEPFNVYFLEHHNIKVWIGDGSSWDILQRILGVVVFNLGQCQTNKFLFWGFQTFLKINLE